MSDHPTRRDLIKPVQLLGLAFLAAAFAFVVTLISMGFFQRRYASESSHALVVAAVVGGITFIVTLLVIALLILAVDPAQIVKPVDRAVLLPPEDAVATDTAAPSRQPARGDEGAEDAAAAETESDGDAPRAS